MVECSTGHSKTQRHKLDAQTKRKSKRYTWKKCVLDASEKGQVKQHTHIVGFTKHQDSGAVLWV